MNYMILFLIGSLNFIFTSILLIISIKVLPYYNIVDVPSYRRNHTNDTPRGGGIAIVISFCISFIIYEYITYQKFYYSLTLLVVTIYGAIISFLDDIKGVSVLFRFISHLLISTYIVLNFVYPQTIFHGDIPLALDMLFLILCLTAYINIYNFLDGIDGITASNSIYLSVIILLLCYLRFDEILHVKLVILISWLVLFSSIAFIYLNWYPAKIFLGDVGSVTLGLLLGTCLLFIAVSESRLLCACIIASMYYLADGGLTIIIRLSKGEKIWLPHLQHFFQQAVAKGTNFT